jgi:hypothetical protein
MLIGESYLLRGKEVRKLEGWHLIWKIKRLDLIVIFH